MRLRIELWQLRYFVAVAEELNFRRAAERLSITQPPLTRQMQALERTVGAPLFERAPSGVTLTEDGRQLLLESRKLLASADDLLSRIGQRAAERIGQSELRIGITTVVDASLFTWLDNSLKASLPNLKLLQKRQLSKRSVTDLRKGAIDLAIIGLPSDTADLTVEWLTLDPLVAAIPERHKFAKRRVVSLAELGHDRLFWFSRSLNPAYFDHFDALFARIGFDPPRVPEPSDHHVLLSLIAEGHGVALVPKSLTSIVRAGVLYKTLRKADGLAVGIAVAYLPGRLSAPARALLEKLKDHFEPASP